MNVVRRCLIVVALVFGALFVAFWIAQFLLNRRAEAMAWSQIAWHYRATQIAQNDRVYFGTSRIYYENAQICYDVSITSSSGTTMRRVVMVSGDDDGGTFAFDREYPSMAACEADFDHG